MQLLFSRIREGTPWLDKQAATARPDGPAPTIIGPSTNPQLGIGSLQEPILAESKKMRGSKRGFWIGKTERKWQKKLAEVSFMLALFL